MEAPREIRIIFGGPHFAGETCGAQDHYARETKDRSFTNVDNLDKRPVKHFKGENDDITFSDSDAHHIHHPHCDALFISVMVANNNVHRILVDNGSSVDILYYQAFQKMILVDNGSSIDILYYQAFQKMGLKVSNLKPSPNSVYRFTALSPPWELFHFP